MHDIINFLKAAVNRAPNAGIQGSYVVRGGSIYARNHGIQAGVLLESDLDFNVPADDIEQALGRMKEVEGIEFTGATVVLRSGRLRATISCSREEPPALPAMPTAWQTVPDGFVDALRKALPFVGEVGYTVYLRLMGDRITAIRNTAGIDITVPGLGMPEGLIMQETAQFLISQGQPAEYCRDSEALVFRWADGRWMRAQLAVGAFPPIVDNIFDKAGTDAPVGLDDAWRDAYADAAALSDGVVTVTPGALLGRRQLSAAEVQVTTAVPEGHRSHWPTLSLDPMVLVAEAWNPTRYPDPAAFVGANLRGVVIGTRR